MREFGVFWARWSAFWAREWCGWARPGFCGYGRGHHSQANASIACRPISHAIPPVALSGFELASLELQRFRRFLKVHATELHAEFRVCVSAITPGCCSQAPQPGPAAGHRSRAPPGAAVRPTAHGQCGQDQQPRRHITREFQRSQHRGGATERPRGYPGWSRG